MSILLVAHRGFRSPKGENRMTDFETALQTCSAVEFDIRMTKDKKIIIFHDHHFRRIGNINATVRSLTYDQIKDSKFFKQNPEFLPPLFIEDFINKISDQYKMINVEIKPDRYTALEYNQILEALKLLHQKSRAEIIVSSFGINDLEFISTLPKKFKRGYLVESFSDIDYELIKKFDYFHPYLGTLKLKASLQICKNVGLPLNIWTYKKSKDAQWTKDTYGSLVNAFISDIPDLSWK